MGLKPEDGGPPNSASCQLRDPGQVSQHSLRLTGTLGTSTLAQPDPWGSDSCRVGEVLVKPLRSPV